MSFRMRALTTFIGVEGLIKTGAEFTVLSEGRTLELEKRGYAERISSGPAETPTAAPSETPTLGPSKTAVRPPNEAPEVLSEEAKEGLTTVAAPNVSEGPNVYQARGNLEGLTVSELKGIAAAEKITGYSKMNKNRLIAAITTTQASKGEL